MKRRLCSGPRPLETREPVDFPITDRETGLALREQPPEPTSCCGRGCNGCVWEGYFAAVAYWRDEALLMLDD
jgi:hypothetical protein